MEAEKFLPWLILLWGSSSFALETSISLGQRRLGPPEDERDPVSEHKSIVDSMLKDRLALFKIGDNYYGVGRRKKRKGEDLDVRDDGKTNTISYEVHHKEPSPTMVSYSYFSSTTPIPDSDDGEDGRTLKRNAMKKNKRKRRMRKRIKPRPSQRPMMLTPPPPEEVFRPSDPDPFVPQPKGFMFPKETAPAEEEVESEYLKQKALVDAVLEDGGGHHQHFNRRPRQYQQEYGDATRGGGGLGGYGSRQQQQQHRQRQRYRRPKTSSAVARGRGRGRYADDDGRHFQNGHTAGRGLGRGISTAQQHLDTQYQRPRGHQHSSRGQETQSGYGRDPSFHPAHVGSLDFRSSQVPATPNSNYQRPAPPTPTPPIGNYRASPTPTPRNSYQRPTPTPPINDYQASPTPPLRSDYQRPRNDYQRPQPASGGSKFRPALISSLDLPRPSHHFPAYKSQERGRDNLNFPNKSGGYGNRTPRVNPNRYRQQQQSRPISNQYQPVETSSYEAPSADNFQTYEYYDDDDYNFAEDDEDVVYTARPLSPVPRQQRRLRPVRHGRGDVEVRQKFGSAKAPIGIGGGGVEYGYSVGVDHGGEGFSYQVRKGVDMGGSHRRRRR